MMFPKPRKRSPVRRSPTLGGRPCTMGELRSYVLMRDKGCILSTLGVEHDCRGVQTLEHVVGVHDHHDVRRDDEAHCVGLDSFTNVAHVPKEQREIIREYLRGRYPSCVSSEGER